MLFQIANDPVSQVSQNLTQNRLGAGGNITANADGVLVAFSNVDVALSCFGDGKKPRGEAGRKLRMYWDLFGCGDRI